MNILICWAVSDEEFHVLEFNFARRWSNILVPHCVNAHCPRHSQKTLNYAHTRMKTVNKRKIYMYYINIIYYTKILLFRSA